MNHFQLAKLLKNIFFLFKKKGIYILPFSLLTYLAIFFYSPQILLYLEKQFQQKFVFFTVSEPILSLLRFSFTIFFIITFPFTYLGLISLANEFLNFKKSFFILFYFLGLLFFYLGVAFAYFLTLPYGIKFLLSFKTESLEASISLSNFVNFFSFFLLAFGLIFELPLFLALLSLLKILKPQKLTKYRREIFFFCVVFAAIITPTPDAINMSLLAIPLYILFEVGLILGKFLERINIREVDTQREPQPD
ncbi:MAG: twin-arginine translocase subunit TatC [Caldimicrobium sp.]